jgi:hypothetical protein
MVRANPNGSFTECSTARLCIAPARLSGPCSIKTAAPRRCSWRDGILERELNRSYYCSDAYDYPIALTELPNGRVAVIHCPSHYKRLEIEDAESGETQTPGGKYLVSGGWNWHPWCTAQLFDLHLGFDRCQRVGREVEFSIGLGRPRSSGSNTLVVSSMFDPDDFESGPELPRSELCLWSIEAKNWLARYPFDELIGTLFASDNFAFGLYGHPKLIDLRNGAVVRRWSDLFTGRQRGPIELGGACPAVAFDPVKFRLAIAVSGGVVVLSATDSAR